MGKIDSLRYRELNYYTQDHRIQLINNIIKKLFAIDFEHPRELIALKRYYSHREINFVFRALENLAENAIHRHVTIFWEH